MRDGGNVHHRVIVGQRVIAGVIAERSLQMLLARIHVPLDDDFRIGRHFEWLRHTLDQLDRLAAQPAREHHLVNVGWQWRGASPDDCRIATQRHRNRNSFRANVLRDALMLRAAFVTLPVHPQRLLIEQS